MLNEYEKKKKRKKISGSGGIRTHAPEETGALNQRLRPLGHATFTNTVFLLFSTILTRAINTIDATIEKRHKLKPFYFQCPTK